MNRVVVTGAGGFLGRHVANACRHAGADVIGVTRPGADAQPATGVHDIASPESTAEAWRPIVRGADTIFHLAVRRAAVDSASVRACLETNVVLTEALLRACVEEGTPRFVFFAAGNAYSPDGEGPAREDEPLYPVVSAPMYLGSKVLAETLVEHYRRVRGLPAVSLRISSPFGSGMPQTSVVSSFMRQAAGGAIKVQDGGGYRADLVFVDDVVAVALAAARAGDPGVYNVGSGVATSMLELATAIAEVCGNGVTVDVQPAGPSPQRGFRALDITKAKATWRWSPTPLRQALQRVAAARA